MVEKRERSSNFELMRILCRFILIIHRYTLNGGAVGKEGLNTNRKVSLIILPLGKRCR